jgi:6-phosphofructokinase 1
MPWQQSDFDVKSLAPRAFPSPLGLATAAGEGIAYVPDDARIPATIETRGGQPFAPLLLEKAGPRAIHHIHPRTVRARIVACGGNCPGINNVVRSLVLELIHKYGVRDVVGFLYGFEGLNPAVGLPPIALTHDDVRLVHQHGGCFIGLSRGAQPVDVMVQTLVDQGIHVLFAIGGDGTLRGAHAIAEEITRRGLDIAVVAVPKTIDNDVEFVDETFGFATAVEVARGFIDAAHVEAWGARNGIAIVKLMGRESGFIACAATIASADVNFCLIPEVQYRLDGPHGFFAALEARLASRRHAVVVVAEGCGLVFANAYSERDASGNFRLASDELDVGPRLRAAIVEHFGARNIPVTVRYIDPSYLVRSVPANATDAMYCEALARNAVHAAMAGKTDLVIGRVHRVFAHVPIGVATARRKRVDPNGDLWLAVTEATGQPRLY